MRRFLLLLTFALSLTLALGVQVAPAAALTVGQPQAVPGGEDSSLRSVSCGSKTECVAIGGSIQDSGVGHLVVVRISGGRVLPANTSSRASVGDVACPTASDCIAVGGVVATIRNGTPGPSKPIPGGNGREILESVSCWSASDCVAVGSADLDGDGQPSGLVVSIKDGVPQSPVSVPSVRSLYAVECESATCQSTGAATSSAIFPPGTSSMSVVTIRNGIPGDPVDVGGAVPRVLACASTTTCLVPSVGAAPAPGTAPPPPSGDGAKVITLVNGKPTAPRTVANPPFFFRSLACASATNCLAIGFSPSRDGFSVASFTDTQAGQSRSYPHGNYFDSTCVGSAGCLAVGGTPADRGSYNASVISLGYKLGGGSGAALTTQPKVAGSSVSVGVSCAASTGKSCAVKGLLTTVKGGSVIVGTKKVTVKGGGKSTLKVTLNAKGKTLLARSGRLAVTLKVSSTTGGKTKTVAKRKLTFKR